MDLFIGSGQLAYFWPKQDTIFVSPRNVNIDELSKRNWSNIYIAFAKGDTFLEKPEESESFYAVNVVYTLEIIDALKNKCNKIYFFSTSELWNRHQGALNLEKCLWNFDFDTYSPYINSKAIVTDKLLSYRNVIILFPFSFNSPYRTEKRFLFGKIFDSILYQSKTTIGNICHYRDLIHPRFVVKEARNARESKIIGSGRLTHVCDFARALYGRFGMEYSEFVTESGAEELKIRRNIFYLDSQKCLYSELFDDTVADIELLRK
jgi:nucleoside-diphosphate-sugar epimerase